MNNVFAAEGIESYNKNRMADPPLSDIGERQADCIGQFFADKTASALLQPIDALWVSPHRRTLQTCAPAAASLDHLVPMVWPLCHELGGIYESFDNNTRREGRGGFSRAEMMASWPTYLLPEDVTEDGWYDVSLNCESTQHCRQRANKVTVTHYGAVGSKQPSVRESGCCRVDQKGSRGRGRSHREPRHRVPP